MFVLDHYDPDTKYCLKKNRKGQKKESSACFGVVFQEVFIHSYPQNLPLNQISDIIFVHFVLITVTVSCYPEPTVLSLLTLQTQMCSGSMGIIYCFFNVAFY